MGQPTKEISRSKMFAQADDLSADDDVANLTAANDALRIDRNGLAHVLLLCRL
jgi:hypothetical protein